MTDEGGSFDLEVITPRQMVFDGVVRSVTAPGFLGQFEVLPGHVPYVTAMRPGLLAFEHDGKLVRYVLGHGFAEVGTGKVRLLTERFEAVEAIDLARATEEMLAAERTMLEKEPRDPAYLDARATQEMNCARVIAASGSPVKT